LCYNGLMNFLKPKQAVFYELLKNVSRSLSKLTELFLQLTTEFKDFEGFAKKAKDLEHEGDDHTHAIIDKLNKTFITPFDREDIYSLAGKLDDIVDLLEDAIHNIYIYNLTENHPALKKFGELMSESSVCLADLLVCLEQQKHTDQLAKAKAKMHLLEDQGDELFSEAIASLFQDNSNPITIIKLKDILETLEDIMDKFQQVGDIIEGIVVKSS
jgi:uncharacterized protein